MTLEERLEAFTEEWARTIKDVEDAVARKDFGGTHDIVTLWAVSQNGIGGNYISYEGSRHLDFAADLLLKEQHLQQKLSHQSAREALIDAFHEQLLRAKNKKKTSIAGLLTDAKRRLDAKERLDGQYVFPVLFAPSATKTNSRIGPVRIVARAIFQNEQSRSLEKAHKDDVINGIPSLADRWNKYAEGYDHVIVVEIKKFEREMAWKTAREAAEYVLNLIRMVFRFPWTDDIKIAGNFMGEKERSALIIASDGTALPEWSAGPWGTHLKDDWQHQFANQTGGCANLLAGFAHWLTSGHGVRSPVLQRLRYANQLISEVYCEPHDHIRLVRLIAALEALALLERVDKAHELGLRCASAGGWGDTVLAMQIFDAVQIAYQCRNAIVHGDLPEPEEIRTAFLGLEEHLLTIFIGFLTFFGHISSSMQVQSISSLRREVKKRIDLFFWNPDILI